MISSKKQKTRVLIAGLISIIVFFVYAAVHNITFKTNWEYEIYGDGYKIISYNQAYDDSADSITVPSEYNGKKVIALSDKVFYKNKKLKSVTVPDSVTELGSSVFKQCKNLESVVLSTNLTVMGGECFRACKSLKTIELPDSLKELRGETFMDCTALETVVLPSFITEIKGNTFENCTSLREIDIPSGVERIAAHAFYNCESLSYVSVPDTVKEIGSSAFRRCDSLTTIELPEGVSVNERAFKESPTIITKKEYTDEQKERILEELNSFDSMDAYVVHKKGDPNEISYINNMLYITDSADYSKQHPEYEAIYKDGKELLKCLEKAKSENCEAVVVELYSKVASEIKGETTFVAVNVLDLDTAISMVIIDE